MSPYYIRTRVSKISLQKKPSHLSGVTIFFYYLGTRFSLCGAFCSFYPAELAAVVTPIAQVKACVSKAR